MRNVKKLLSLLLVVLMAVFLTAGIVGCDNAPAPAPGDDADVPEMTEEEEAMEAAYDPDAIGEEGEDDGAGEEADM